MSDIAALVAELDQLRAEVKRLSARVREWEQTLGDLATRCDSGDIPIRLGERYSVAVLREIDRLRADDLAIRRLLRDYGVSVGGVDPLPAVVAETLDGLRKVDTALADLRYWLVDALEMVGTPDDDAIVREARAALAARIRMRQVIADLEARRDEYLRRRDAETDRSRRRRWEDVAHAYDTAADLVRRALHAAATAALGTTPDTGSAGGDSSE